MIWFFVAIGVLLVIAVLGVLQPYFRARKIDGASRAQLNLGIYRDQVTRLDQDLAEGLLAPDQAKASMDEIQSRLVHEAVDEPATTMPHASRATVIAIGIGVPLAALVLYAFLGAPDAILSSSRAPQAGDASPPDVQAMVAGLAKKLEREPENLQGWAMLGRSYKVLGNTREAEKAFERAGSFVMNDAQLLADYADVTAANAEGDFSGKPTRLIERALAVDPRHPMALWLAGAAAMQKNDRIAAVAYLQRLLKVLPPDSEDARMIESTLANLRPAAPK